MHHFIYPSQDTFVTNTINYPNKNFGLDEILRVGTKNCSVKITFDTKTFSYAQENVSGLCIQSFTGNVSSGSLNGYSYHISGSITSGTGSISGVGFSGSGFLYGSIFNGNISGFNGEIDDFTGNLSGIITGNYVVSQSYQDVVTRRYVNRALVKFNLSEISKSISSGDIQSPKFTLKLKVAREENLPISYTLYSFPISQSWVMGDGYLSDGGSNKGASWNYKDLYSGSVWSEITDTDGLTPIDFISDPSLTYQVWNRGGGTWYTNSCSSQSFNYEAGDINMDVSNIVNEWIVGNIPNEGFILISSEETLASGSDAGLYFFSKDTNTIYQPCLDVGWDDTTWVTGSVSTGSVVISTIEPGYNGTIIDASITGSNVSGSFTGISNYIADVNTSASGVISVNGSSGTIIGLSIYGNFSGSFNSSSYILMGTLFNGIFSGSTFTASLNGYVLNNGSLTGSWNPQAIIGNKITSTYPFSLYPNIYSTVTGPYINGTTFGTFNVSDPFNSSYNGIFTTGLFNGSMLNALVSGTFFTSSYSYTSSVTIVSSSLSPIEFNVPFVMVVQNLTPTIQAGSIIRVNVFARPEFPLKNFQRRTQFTQYLTPQYLPVTSYYAIKDNETDQIVLDFDNYTRLSCDMNGNYFLIDTTGLPQERYFKLLLKTEQSGSIYAFDKGDIFKIVR